MNRESVNLRIREILAQKGMDCTSLAAKMGKSPSYINNVLNKRKDMSLNALIAIAEALEVKFGDLFVSSFSPNTPFENEFVAMVKCRRGVFTADSLAGLQNIVDTLSDRSTNLIELIKRTLERMLRFPDGKDARIISELIADLSQCMNPDEWRNYYKRTIADLLPTTFQVDYGYLSTFMTPDDILMLERSTM